MEFEIGSVIKMKKPHPCGENRWEILRVGMDFRLKCQGCGHQVMVPRKVVEKNFKVSYKKYLLLEINHGKIKFRDVKIIIPCSFQGFIPIEKSQRPKGGAGNYE